MLYYCNDCLICTPNLSDYNKHIKTMKHYKKVISKNPAVLVEDLNKGKALQGSFINRFKSKMLT